MKGYVLPASVDDDTPLPLWQELIVNAVGTVIEFWGFKRNQGRVWGLLYLRGVALTAADVRSDLALSKGAVSMILRELETWGVIQRVRKPGSSSWHFIAEVDLMSMIGHVFREREVLVVQRVKEDLAEASRLAALSEDIPEAMLERLERMRMLAGLIEHALQIFLKTARLDMTEVRGIFKEDEDS